jgi:hypothetical protein
MIVEVLRGARWLDATLARTFGPWYHGILGIGLVTEIVRRLHEAGELNRPTLLRTIFAVTLYSVLLLHQLSELSEYFDRRFRRSSR